MRTIEDICAANMTRGMKEAADGLKEDYRNQMRATGLNERVVKAGWQARVYPASGRSLDPAGYVYSKAPLIIDSMIAARTITPLNGKKYLAIPTDKVPRRGKRRMTPEEVENFFNQDLVVRPARNRGHLLGFVNVIAARNSKGFRRATKQRLAQGRNVRLVLMFTFVPQVRTRKRIDFEGTARKWGELVPGLVEGDWTE
jgi:hypothetical protein